jgi:N-acetyltransferase
MSGFNYQPVLEGELITMRPYQEADWDELFAVARDPLIWELHPVHNRWKEPVFRYNIDDAFADQGGLVAIERASGRIIGYSRYSCTETEADEVEIGWTFLARRFWGGRVNLDMKRQMLTHALAHFPTVIFRVGENNLRSRRAVEKIGGRLIERRSLTVFQGVEIWHVTYLIDRAGFEGGPLAG